MIPKLSLAPMAGVTDYAFRKVCASLGAPLTYTEMVSAKAILYDNKKTFGILRVSAEEKRVAVQLFGREPDIIAEAGRRIEEKMPDKIAFFDINMGCPAPKIVNNGEGCALMKEPELASNIVMSLRAAVNVPVTVKFRKGFKDDTAVEFAKQMEQAGVVSLCVHGRTREQYYHGVSDIRVIEGVKNAVRVPVVGNGDVIDGPSARHMLNATGCDAIMVARGALGNPFIFREIEHYLNTGQIIETSYKSKIQALLLQASLACEDKGERVAMREMRKHIAWYIKGRPNAARLRERAMRVELLSELQDLMI